jgi:hypothetical protein
MTQIRESVGKNNTVMSSLGETRKRERTKSRNRAGEESRVTPHRAAMDISRFVLSRFRDLFGLHSATTHS